MEELIGGLLAALALFCSFLYYGGQIYAACLFFNWLFG